MKVFTSLPFDKQRQYMNSRIIGIHKQSDPELLELNNVVPQRIDVCYYYNADSAIRVVEKVNLPLQINKKYYISDLE